MKRLLLSFGPDPAYTDSGMWRTTRLVAALSLGLTVAAGAEQVVYKIELRANNSLWAKERPVQNGQMLLFRRYPDGALLGLKAAQVLRIVAVPTKALPPGAAGLKPGEQLILGPTAGGGGAPSSGAEGTAAVPAAGLRPGEAKGGTALFNPDRAYRPDWDSKLVPGATIANPASPNDYKEGRTVAYPPAGAVQSAPGQPPMMPEAPKD